MVALAAARGPDGKSVIHACETTALPGRFEQLAFWGTRVVLGDYYKTYGAGSEDVEESVSFCCGGWILISLFLFPCGFSVEEFIGVGVFFLEL